MTEVVLIIPDFDGGKMLTRCLESVERQSLPPRRVVVFDDGSTVPVTERTDSLPAGVEVMRSDRNLGFATAANRAIGATREELVALVNNDVVLDPGWMEACVSALEQRHELAAVQTRNVRPDGRLDGEGIVIHEGRILQDGHGEEPGTDGGSLRQIWGVSATAAVYRREALESVARGDEVFREQLGMYYEDVDLAARLRDRGWSSALIERSLAIHEGSGSAERLAGRAVFLRVRNRYLVHSLHPEVGSTIAFLNEDARAILRSLASFELPSAWQRARGVVSGVGSLIGK